MMELDYWVQPGLTDWSQYQQRITEIHKKLMNKEDSYTGWVDHLKGNRGLQSSARLRNHTQANLFIIQALQQLVIINGAQMMPCKINTGTFLLIRC